jgi:hypothetical protein
MKTAIFFFFAATLILSAPALGQTGTSFGGNGAVGSGFIASNNNSSGGSRTGGFGGGTFGVGGFPSVRPFTGYPGLLTYNMGGFFRGQSLSDPAANGVNPTGATAGTSGASSSSSGGGSGGGTGGGSSSGGGSGSSSSRNVIGDDWIY